MKKILIFLAHIYSPGLWNKAPSELNGEKNEDEMTKEKVNNCSHVLIQ